MIRNKTISEKVFTFATYTILILVGLTAILPFLHVLAKSMSGELAVISGQVTFWPIDLELVFEGLPESVEESARIDGASNLKYFIKGNIHGYYSTNKM